MRFARPGSRTLALALFAGLAVAVLVIRKRTPTTSVTEPPASASVLRGASARGDAGVTDASPNGADFVDAATTDADAHDATPMDPTCLAQAMTKLEPHARWLARFDGTPAADKQAPPKLGELRDLRTLPPGQLAFVRSGRIYVMDLPQGAPRAVTSGGRDSSPRFSPRGTHVAFMRGDERGDSRVHLVRADGSDLRRLAATPAYGPLTFSSDGRYLAFSTTERDVVIHDLDTGAEQRMAGRPSERTLGPVFEPSSHRLAFTSGDELFVGDATTGRAEPHELPNFIEIQSIAFVPGALLVSVTTDHTPGGPFVVRRVQLDRPGSFDVEFLPTPLAVNGVGLFASPTASRIALENNSLARTHTSQPDGTVLTEMGDWWRRDVIFYDRRRPSKDTSVSDLPQPRFMLRSPAWASDDRHLAFVVELTNMSNQAEPHARGILAVDTNAPRPAPVHVACGDSPAWGPAAKP
jgi:hypothetical protein